MSYRLGSGSNFRDYKAVKPKDLVECDRNSDYFIQPRTVICNYFGWFCSRGAAVRRLNPEPQSPDLGRALGDFGECWFHQDR